LKFNTLLRSSSNMGDKDKFHSYEWEKDPNWVSYISNITIPDPSKQDEIVAKLKLKFYKKNIDPDYEPPHPSSSSSSSSSSHNNCILDTFPAGPLSCNCSILADPVTKEGVLVDPGGHPETIIQKLKLLDVKIKYILITHAHFDHFLAADIIKNHTGAKVVLHKEDLPLWSMLELQCSMFGAKSLGPVSQPEWLLDSDADIKVNDRLVGKALHTPGHSPGSTCFLFESVKVLFSGDTLFKGSVGRTDLWGGDKKALLNSIKTKIYPLSDDVVVISGHGSSTTIAHEKQYNPFVRSNI